MWSATSQVLLDAAALAEEVPLRLQRVDAHRAVLGPEVVLPGEQEAVEHVRRDLRRRRAGLDDLVAVAGLRDPAGDGRPVLLEPAHDLLVVLDEVAPAAVEELDERLDHVGEAEHRLHLAGRVDRAVERLREQPHVDAAGQQRLLHLAERDLHLLVVAVRPRGRPPARCGSPAGSRSTRRPRSWRRSCPSGRRASRCPSPCAPSRRWRSSACAPRGTRRARRCPHPGRCRWRRTGRRPSRSRACPPRGPARRARCRRTAATRCRTRCPGARRPRGTPSSRT